MVIQKARVVVNDSVRTTSRRRKGRHSGEKRQILMKALREGITVSRKVLTVSHTMRREAKGSRRHVGTGHSEDR